MSDIDINPQAQAMFEQAQAVCQHAYVPYSKFQVGCCIRTDKGTLFCGCNIENIAYGLATCAEAATIASMVSAGQQHIQELVVMANTDIYVAPCGACRQRIVEFAKPTTLIHLANAKKICKTMTLEQLLPEAFGPHNMK